MSRAGGLRMFQGEGGPAGIRFACVDPSVRYTAPQVCGFAFSAKLAPFPSEEDARAALVAAGADLIVEVGR